MSNFGFMEFSVLNLIFETGVRGKKEVDPTCSASSNSSESFAAQALAHQRRDGNALPSCQKIPLC
jgi:hypothetical protein